MQQLGRARAPGAGTVVNALAAGRGSAFALELFTEATVELTDDDGVTGTITGVAETDTALIERCVALTTEQFGSNEGGRVETTTDIPPAAGLKSSSAAANAAVLATLAALGRPVGPDGVSRLTACRIGVTAAREAGVTVTGAFDDASASMLGGVTVTDNTTDELLAHESFTREAVVWTPPERAYSADTSLDRCEQVAPMAELAVELAREGRVEPAMTVNGLAFSAALGYPMEPAVAAMSHCGGVSLSGTGPSVVAVGGDTARVAAEWADLDGTVRRVQTDETGGEILDAADS